MSSDPFFAFFAQARLYCGSDRPDSVSWPHRESSAMPSRNIEDVFDFSRCHVCIL